VVQRDWPNYNFCFGAGVSGIEHTQMDVLHRTSNGRVDLLWGKPREIWDKRCEITRLGYGKIMGPSPVLIFFCVFVCFWITIHCKHSSSFIHLSPSATGWRWIIDIGKSVDTLQSPIHMPHGVEVVAVSILLLSPCELHNFGGFCWRGQEGLGECPKVCKSVTKGCNSTVQNVELFGYIK